MAMEVIRFEEISGAIGTFPSIVQASPRSRRNFRLFHGKMHIAKDSRILPVIHSRHLGLSWTFVDDHATIEWPLL